MPCGTVCLPAVFGGPDFLAFAAVVV